MPTMTQVAAAVLGIAAGLSGSGGGTAPTLLVAPQIVSNMVVGIPMSVVPGVYMGTVTSRNYQWLKGGVNIAGATASTYTAVTGDAQGVITVIETVNGGTQGTSPSVIVSPASGVYATALAAATDGQYFTAPSPDNSGARLRIYQRVASAVSPGVSGGVLVDVTPASSTVNVAAALCRPALSQLSPIPLVALDSTDCFYGENEFQSRVPGDPVRTFNLLGYYSHSNGYGIQGAVVVIPRVADSSGGTLATQIQMPIGTALLTYFVGTRIPPGVWTLSFKAKTSGQASSQTMQFSQNGTTGLSLITVTSAWTQFSVTFNNLVEGGFNSLIVHGEYPSVSLTARDITIDNLQLTPGTAAPALADTTAHPSIYGGTALAYSGMELHSVTAGAANGNALNAKLASIATFGSFTIMSTLNGISGASLPTLLTFIKNGTPFTGTYIAENAATNNGQSPAQTEVATTNALLGSSWAGAGRIVFTVVANTTAGTMTCYINGVRFETLPYATTISNVTALLMNAYFNGTSSAQFTLLADLSAHTFWGAALTDAQVVSNYAIHNICAVAKGLTLQVTKNVLFACGDSRSRTSLDGTTGATFHRRCASLLTGTRIQIESEAIDGSTFAIMLARLTADTLRINAYKAAGINVVSTVLIGTNDDGTAGGLSLTTQAAVDDYYLNKLVPYYASLRALGVKVVACTEICNGRSTAYDGTSTGIITATTANSFGSLAGNTYTSWRYYLNALLLQHAADTTLYDAIVDLGTATGFTTYAASTASMGDVVHPNALGHSELANQALTAVQSLMV